MKRFILAFFALALLIPIAEAGFVRVDGKYFALDGNRWYPHGVNYFPSFYEERPPTGQDRSWLQDVYYQQPGNREQVDRELDKIRDLGFNFLIIQGIKEERYCNNLNDFLDKARNRELKVSIYMHNSDPLLNFILGPQTYERDLRIIQQCNLAGNDAVFGYELDWEPSLEPRWTDRADFPYTERRRNLPQFKAQWAEWLRKQYGSIEHAYQNWGYTPPRIDAESDDAQCVSHTLPARALVNIPYTITFTMKNVGRTDWTPERTSLSLLGAPLSLSQNVAPGGEATFIYTYTIPPAPGTQINVYWQMINNGRVFGDSCSAPVTFVSEQPTNPVPITMIEQTQVYTPTDQQFCNEGSWRPYVAAYSHFMNDAIGDAYRRMVEAYKDADQNHIVYAHIGSPDFMWEPSCRVVEYNKRWSMAKYLDVVPEDFYGSISWYNTEGFPNILKRSGFRAGYDDVGKPVIAVEAGLTSECNPTYIGRCSQDDQALFYQALYDMFLHSSFTGSASWWFTGRQIDDYATSQAGHLEYNNYGIVENNTLNEYPAAGFIRGMAAAMKSDRTWNPTTDLVVDPDAYSSFQGFYRDSANRYLALVNQGQQPRALTTCSTDSARVELICVGNRQNDGACPLKCLHSRFLSLDVKDVNDRWVEAREGSSVAVVRGEPLEARALIENLQETKWLDGSSTGSVQIAARNSETEDTARAPLGRDVEGLSDYETGSFVYSDGLTENTTMTFFLEAYQRSAFGERVNIRLTVPPGLGLTIPANTTNTSRPHEPLPRRDEEPTKKKAPEPTPPKTKTDVKLPSEPQKQPALEKERSRTSNVFLAIQKQTLAIATMAIVLLLFAVILIFLIRKMRRRQEGNRIDAGIQ